MCADGEPSPAAFVETAAQLGAGRSLSKGLLQRLLPTRRRPRASATSPPAPAPPPRPPVDARGPTVLEAVGETLPRAPCARSLRRSAPTTLLCLIAFLDARVEGGGCTQDLAREGTSASLRLVRRRRETVRGDPRPRLRPPASGGGSAFGPRGGSRSPPRVRGVGTTRGGRGVLLRRGATTNAAAHPMCYTMRIAIIGGFFFFCLSLAPEAAGLQGQACTA